MRKHTYEEVKKTYNDANYTLVSKEYHRSTDKLEYLCDVEGHGIQSMSYANFKQGYRCPICAGNATLTHEFVKDAFAKREFTLMSKEYINSNSKLKYLCTNHSHGIQEITWANFTQGKGCPVCAGNTLPPYEFMSNEFKNKGYTLVSKNCKGYKDMLEYVCDKHGTKFITWNNFSQGRGCHDCGREATANKKRLDYDKVKKDYANYGYELVSKEYINNSSKLDIICPVHGIIQSTYANLMKGQGVCLQCHLDNNTGENSANWKGGITPLTRLIRGYIDDSIQESLKIAKYTCEITKTTGGNLAVHHSYGFNLILRDTLDKLGLEPKENIGEYTNIELSNIKEVFMEIQSSYKLIVLSKAIHDLFHSIYGHGNNTPQQFQEFRERYDNNEFAD